MDETQDYPLAPVIAALRTVMGRLFIVTLCIVAGAAIGWITAAKSVQGVWDSLLSLHQTTFGSVFYGIGFVAWPLIVVFTIAFVRSYWPLWIPLIFVIPMAWWNYHMTIDYAINRSPMARMEEILEESLREISEEREDAQPSGTVSPLEK